MLTLLGAVLIMAACVFAGQKGAARLSLHRNHLLGAEQGLRALAREIRYLATPLAEAMQHAAGSAGSCRMLFETAAAQLLQKDGISGEEAWLLALAETKTQWSAAEYAALTVVAAGLGKTDCALQLQQLDLAAERILACEKAAAEREARFAKIWRSMGWAGGAVLVLLLL